MSPMIIPKTPVAIPQKIREVEFMLECEHANLNPIIPDKPFSTRVGSRY